MVVNGVAFGSHISPCMKWPHMSQMKCLMRAQNWMWHWSTKNQMWCFVSKQKISSVAKPAQIAMPVLFGFFIVEAAINGWKTMSLHKSAARKKLSLVWVCQPHKWSNSKRMCAFNGGDKIRLHCKTPLPCLQTISLPWFSDKGHCEASVNNKPVPNFGVTSLYHVRPRVGSIDELEVEGWRGVCGHDDAQPCCCYLSWRLSFFPEIFPLVFEREQDKI